MAAAAATVIDRDNPWPWLDPFTEGAEAFFKGREDDSAALERCVGAAPATVLFGKSGLGKTSLLQAGLFPRLRQAALLPVIVRLRHGAGAPPAAAQIRARLQEECLAHGLTPAGDARLAPGLEAAEDRLWLDLHTSPQGLRDAGGKAWQPVLVLDQFEEIFTLGGQDPARQRKDFGVIGDLVENRIPSVLEQAIDADEDILDHLLLDAQPYRVVLSLREDYLPDLERWCDRIPRLGPNRYRLLPMNEAQALDAVLLSSGGLVTPEDAQRIVSFVSSQQKNPADSQAAPERGGRRIEPALLSLLCSGLNAERQARGLPRIDASNLDLSGGQIIEKFYSSAFAGISPAVAVFLEDELITPDGVRLAYPLESVLKHPGISQADIDALIDRRLLRKETSPEGDCIEVVHDRLAAVARQRHQSRETAAEQRRLKDEAARSEHERARLARLQGWLKSALALLSVVLIAAVAGFWQAREAGHKAAEAARQAAILRLSAEGFAMAAGEINGEPLRGVLEIIAAHRMASTEASTVSQITGAILQGEYQRSNRLLHLIEHRSGEAGASPSGIVSIAISPAGDRIVTGDEAGALRLWDADSGALSGPSFAGHRDWITSVAYGPDGRSIASGSVDGSLRLWDAATGQPMGAPLKGHDGWVYSVAFSPDGKWVVSGGDDMTLRLWEVATGKAIGILRGHTGRVFCVAFSPDGRLIASGSGDKTVRLWNAATGAPIGKPLTGHASWVNALAFSRDGKRIVSGGKDASLRLWNAETGKAIGEPFKGHSMSINGVAISPDGQHLISGSDDKTLRLWDIASRTPVGEPFLHADSVRSVAFSRDGKHIVSGSEDKTLRIWDVSSPAGQSIMEHDEWVNSVAFSPDGTRIVSGSMDGTLRLWDAASGDPLRTLVGHDGQVNSVAFSPDGTRIASASSDNTLRLWDAASGSPVGMPLRGHEDQVYSVAFSPDGQRLVSGSTDRTVRLWSASTGAQIGPPLRGHEDQVNGVAFSPDGRSIVSASADYTLRLWDAASGAPIGQPLAGHEDQVYSVAFSPDGTRIASGGADQTLRLWDVATRRLIKTLKGHTGQVTSVAFSHDGKRMASGSRDKTVLLWDLASARPISAPMHAHFDSVESVAFSPDGRYIASGSRDTTIRLWSIPAGSWPDALCAKLPRNMSRAEWRQWVSPDMAYVVQCPSLPAPND